VENAAKSLFYQRFYSNSDIISKVFSILFINLIFIENFLWRKRGEYRGEGFVKEYYQCSFSETAKCMAKKEVVYKEDDTTPIISFSGKHSCPISKILEKSQSSKALLPSFEAGSSERNKDPATQLQPSVVSAQRPVSRVQSHIRNKIIELHEIGATKNQIVRHLSNWFLISN
jgi:hypothetical protein